jgi:hypothetical protein
VLSEIDDRLIGAAADMDLALTLSTGLDELSRKKVIYFTLATHVLSRVQTFPQLVLLGKMGTGKSETLKIIGKFARGARMLSLRAMTLPAIRDALAECQQGTAIIEEADYAWKDPTDFERLLSDRYQRTTAKAAHKVSIGRDWETVTKTYFGATVLHRRIGFNDAALDGRSIVVRFRADHSREYYEFNDGDPWITEGSQLVRGLNFEPPIIEHPPRVAARVFNTYRLLLGLAQLCRDEDFSAQILPSLIHDTAELSESQSAEPDGLVLRAIVEVVFRSDTPNFRNIKLGDLVNILWSNHRWSVQPRQVGMLARELGFETKPSHGVTVVVPTPSALVRACDECDYKENVIEELRKELFGGAEWQG